MCVDKGPVETIKDGNEDCCRTGHKEIGKIGGNGHFRFLSKRVPSGVFGAQDPYERGLIGPTQN
jgi:hypothetical protein